jgi:RNA polymerase sigma factor (sigma-70 family)
MSHAPVEHLLRELAPQVLGALVRRYRDFAAGEDAVQEALLAASEQWPRYGVPDEPRAWLFTVARRRFADHVRRESARRSREAAVAAEAPEATDDAALVAEADDTLALLFTCCHPALTPASAIALTLRAVGGLTTAEIAKAFLVPPLTMSQRISRAKQSIASSGVPFHVPEGSERASRLGSVLHVLYLIFNEGYTASGGDALHRTDLSTEAIRLARLLHGMLPADPDVTGLLALMLLTDARRAARTGPAGEIVPLDEQDRSLWDHGQIEEGVALVGEALRGGAPGEYQLLAAIAALHDEAPGTTATDWAQIAALYGVLLRLTDNPMARLNHAVAVAMVEGPPAGLDLLAPLDADERLAAHHRLDAVRAHLHERAGERERAVELYRRAAERTTSTPERNYLLARAARLAG